MMAVPVLIPHDVVYVFFIVCAEAESTKLALALISDAGVWFALAGLTQSWRWVKRGEEVGEKNFNVGGELLRRKRIEAVDVDVHVLHPLDKRLVGLLERGEVQVS